MIRALLYSLFLSYQSPELRITDKGIIIQDRLYVLDAYFVGRYNNGEQIVNFWSKGHQISFDKDGWALWNSKGYIKNSPPIKRAIFTVRDEVPPE